jgi:hypothetical protein
MKIDWMCKTMSLALLLMLVSMPLTPRTVGAQKPEIVSIETATLAAQVHINAEARKGTIPVWKEAVPAELVTYYNPDGSIAVYVFSVIKGRENVGFVTLSAYSHPAVLEFSTAPAPHKMILDTACQVSPELDTDIPVFLGPALYVYQTASASEEGSGFITLDGTRMLHLTTNELAQMVQAWHRFVDDSIDQIVESDLVEAQASKVLSVAPVRQGCSTIQPCNCAACGDQCACNICPCSNHCWVGCHPAAGASIMAYWNGHGYSGLGSNVDTIMIALHQHMNTSECGATTRPNSTTGIESYTASKGYDFDTACISTHTGCNGQPPTFQQLVNEIDAGQPVIVAFNGHAYTGIGYDTDGQIAILNSNLGGDPRRIPWGEIASYTGNAASGLITIWPPCDATPPAISFNTPLQDRWYNINKTLSWTISDSGSGVDHFSWDWDESTPGNRVDSNNGSTTLGAAGQGKHTLYVRAWDKAGNATSVESRGWFGYDTAKPSSPFITIDCDVLSKRWQNACRDPSFNWNATDPNAGNGSGVADYAFAWGTEPTADPANWLSTTSYDPGPITDPDGWAKYFLHVKARDVAGNTSPMSAFGFWYDGSQPTGDPVIDGSAETVHSVNVLVNPNGQDTGSGLFRAYLSNDGENWQPMDYAATLPWSLPPQDQTWHTIQIQLEDVASNRSEPYKLQAVCLDLNPAHPASDSYRLWSAGQITGGSYASAAYKMYHTEGQPFARNLQTNSQYRLHSGFQATWPAQPEEELFTANGCAGSPSVGSKKLYLPVVIKSH